MLKRILATALAAAMIFGLANLALAASPFPDTAGVDNEAAIARLKALRIFQGDAGTGLFRPADPISRAEFTAAVVRMLGLEAAAGFVKTPTLFPDVTAAYEWAYGYINIASGRKLIEGYPDGTFQPGKDVTQAEALTILLRAAGYTNDLPGNWPINYVMEGATIGVIETGFSPNVAATRTQVADLVNNTLDINAVEKQTDAAGHFTKFKKELFTVYENSFGVPTGTSKASGKVTAYSTSNKTITVGTFGAITYIDAVTLSGKETIAELAGQYVDVTLNKDGKAIYVAVTTAKEVIGDITAVDTVNLKATVGGTQYTLTSTAEVYKNGDLLTTTTAGALVAIKDASARLLIGTDGKVYRVYASITDQTSDITGKSTEVGADGKVANLITTTLGGGTKYKITSSTTVVRNGASATFADLAIGDEVKYSLKGTEVVYLDAFKNVVKGYTITNYVADASGATVTVKKDSVESTFAVGKKSDGTLYVTLTDILTKPPAGSGAGLGAQYDLTLNRDGKLIGFKAVAAATPTVGKVKTVASKDQAYDSTTKTYKYRLNFTDGTNVVLDDVAFASAKRNGVPLAPFAAVDIWNAVKANDMYYLNSAPLDLEVFAPSVSGYLVHAAADSDFQIFSSGGTELARFTTLFTTAVTLNGIPKQDSKLTVQAANGVATYLGTVKFESSGSSVKPVPTALTAEEFAIGTTALPVAGIASDATEYTFTLKNDTMGSVTVKAKVSDVIVMKGGAKVTPADVAIGDKLLYETLDASDYTLYIKAAADTTAPKVKAGATATWAPGATDGTLTVTFTTEEPVRKAYVWVGGTQEEAAWDSAGAPPANVWKLTKTYATKPGTVTIAVTDFAGNVSTAVDVVVP